MTFAVLSQLDGPTRRLEQHTALASLQLATACIHEWSVFKSAFYLWQRARLGHQSRYKTNVKNWWSSGCTETRFYSTSAKKLCRNTIPEKKRKNIKRWNPYLLILKKEGPLRSLSEQFSTINFWQCGLSSAGSFQLPIQITLPRQQGIVKCNNSCKWESSADFVALITP